MHSLIFNMHFGPEHLMCHISNLRAEISAERCPWCVFTGAQVSSGTNATTSAPVNGKQTGKKRAAPDITLGSAPGSSATSGGPPPCAEELCPPPSVGDTLHGYVKRADGKAGVFVCLDRTREAHIKLRNLSDG